MRVGSFTYLLNQGLKNTYLNKAMSFASVGVLTICLVLVGCAALFSENIKNIIETVQQQNEIVVYVEDDIDATAEAELDRQIRSMANVSEVEYTSKEQAFDNQKEKLGDLLEGYENEDIFPASYNVKVKDLSLVKADVETLSSLKGVYRVDAPTDVAEVMVKAERSVSLIGSIVVVALIIVSFVIIMNTIKITVYNRRKEINIMKYVGATNGFIRMPFLVEGIILGAVAAVIAFLAVWYIYSQLYTSIETEFLSFMSGTSPLIPFSSFALGLGLVYLFTGAIVGGLGSLLSIHKHLKV